LFFRQALLPGGWAADVAISITDGLISQIETGAVPAGPDHGIALPGMANLHSHTFQRAIAGLTEQRGGQGTDNFWTWREMMYRFALRMTPDDVEAVATQAFIEMLEGGFTAVAEFHYLHHAPDGTHYADVAELATRIAAAAAATGIDLLLLPVFYAHAGFGGTPPEAGQRRFISDLDSYAKLLERCGEMAATGVAPHSLRAVAPDELAAVITMAGKKPIHMHIAEQTGEVEDCLAWSGQRPVQWLFDHAEVGARWCLIHATHADHAERQKIAASRAVIGFCPITEANLGDGIFPLHSFEGSYGIGTDSNVLIGVAEELRMLEYAQRLTRRQRNVLAGATSSTTATQIFLNAQAGGAQALDTPAGLRVGAPANFCTIRGKNPDIALAQAVFAARAPAIDSVWVRGRQCVAAGRHPRAEESERRFSAVVQRLLS
jgi:formiminoglutamate deiminase